MIMIIKFVQKYTKNSVYGIFFLSNETFKIWEIMCQSIRPWGKNQFAKFRDFLQELSKNQSMCIMTMDEQGV